MQGAARGFSPAKPNTSTRLHLVRDANTGACHLTEGQAHNWGRRFLLRPSSRSHSAPNSPPSATPLPTRCAAAAYRCACAPRTPDRRQRVRYQPENAQRPLRLRHRRPAPPRTTTCRRRVARGAQWTDLDRCDSSGARATPQAPVPRLVLCAATLAAGAGIRQPSGLPLIHGDRGEETRFDGR
jgi:hypothetical protein